MNKETIGQLLHLNKQFYQTVETSFNKTRQTAWLGWETLWEELQPTNWNRDFSVLDVGCGNGRFAHFLSQKTIQPLTYYGVDDNEALLSYAKVHLSNPSMTGRVFAEDIFDEKFLDLVRTETHQSSFSLVVCFGVLHHLPTAQARQAFVTRLAQLVAPNGYLILSLWQFEKLDRYQKKFLDPEQVGIATDQLEQGDYLLGWDTTQAVRYCHSFSEIEIAQLIAASGLALTTQFTADGREGTANAYLVLHRN